MLSEQPSGATRVLAVIPAHDEAPRIAAVVRGAVTHLPVLVVDDGSTDGTARIAREAGAEVLEQRPNAGKGAALRAGFRHALEAGYDGALTLDGDGQHDPAEIPTFLARLRPRGSTDGARALVLTSSSAGATSRHMPPARRLANTVGGHAFSWAVGTHVPGQPVRDTASSGGG